MKTQNKKLKRLVSGLNLRNRVIGKTPYAERLVNEIKRDKKRF
jgi:hypothetical protein